MSHNLPSIIRGRKTILTPASPDDVQDAWMTGFYSDITPFMAGAPLFPEKPPCTFDEFQDDWTPNYFDGRDPCLGRIFKIQVYQVRVGYITHGVILENRVEMDIWLSGKEHLGKGYGSDALAALCDYVSTYWDVREVFIQPSARNPQAIKAYEKAGFTRLAIPIEEAERYYRSVRDYYDSVYMSKLMSNPVRYNLSDSILIREFHPSDPIPEITLLLHKSYAKLADMGLNFLACRQDDETTLRRLSNAKTFLAIKNGKIIGTISAYGSEENSKAPLYAQAGVFHFGQFSVDPSCQGTGLGKRLYQTVEDYCKGQNGKTMALDTSEKAFHLIAMYERWGFKIVARTQWSTNNYASVIMAKPLD